MAETPKWSKLLSGAAKFIPQAPWVAIVVELVTHLTSAMGVTSSDSKQTLKHIESLRSELSTDLTQITASHASLTRQLNAQTATLVQHSDKLEALANELQLTQLSSKNIELRLTAVESRFAALETRGSRTFALAMASCVLTAIVLVLLVVLLVHQH